jgi:Fe2+ transport system protein B
MFKFLVVFISNNFLVVFISNKFLKKMSKYIFINENLNFKEKQNNELIPSKEQQQLIIQKDKHSRRDTSNFKIFADHEEIETIEEKKILMICKKCKKEYKSLKPYLNHEAVCKGPKIALKQTFKDNISPLSEILKEKISKNSRKEDKNILDSICGIVVLFYFLFFIFLFFFLFYF